MTTKLEKIIEKLKDGAATVIDLKDKDSEELRFNAAFFHIDGTDFELFFPPRSWEVDNLQLGVNCQVAVKHKGTTVNIVAELDRVVNDRRLGFIAREPVKPEDLREYFRISINTSIELAYTPGEKEIKVTPWNMIGTTIDLSASGVLGLFAEKPLTENRLSIKINKPDTQEQICCTGHVIRTYRMRKKSYQVALHFDNIDQETRDKLIACCLKEQRKRLREYIEIID